VIAPRFLFILLAFCMFSTGASGLVNEYVLATLTTYILGNSIEQFSIVIAAMMLMMGVSGLVQQGMSDNNLVHKFMLLEVSMAIVCAFAPLAIYGAYASMQDHFYLVHYFFVLTVGFLIGFEIPLVMRIIEQYKVKLKYNLAIVYAMDYIGAFIGAIIWVKILLKNFPLSEISFIVAGANFLIAVVTLIYFIATGVIRQKMVALLMIVTTLCLLVYGYLNNRDFTDLMEQKFYDDPIVYKETTKYQHLVLTENRASNDIRLYINGNTQFSSLDEARYHEILVHPAFSLAPKIENVLVLGGGDGLALREIVKYSDVHQVTLIDLDPGMIKLAASNPHLQKLNLNVFQDARIHIKQAEGVADVNIKGVYLESSETSANGQPVAEHVASVDVYNIDADLFLGQEVKTQWDVVIIDFPDPSSVELSKLYSKQFYKKLSRLLTADGLIAIQATSPYHAKEAYLTIGNTLKAAGFNVLPYRQNIPSFGDWGFYLAWQNEKSVTTLKSEIRQLTNFTVDTKFLTPELLTASMAFGKGELESKESCVNTIMFPCLLTQYIDYGWNIN
jgi:spermidine synthase